MAKFSKKRSKSNEKITIFLLSLLVFVIFLMIICSFDTITVTSNVKANSSDIVIESDSKRVLFGNNYNTPLPIASTTKILTALTVIDNVNDLDKKVKIPKQAVGIEGSSIYLKEGEELTYLELLYGLMLRSGNDCAVALALSVSNTVDDFVKLMNNKAKECGAKNCNFINPHGLHNDNHLCSAYDLALITSEALKRDVFLKIVSTKSIKISGEPIRYLNNKNKMLNNYDGANGVKTGFTKKSGRCLVTSAKRGNMQLICVVLNHYDMWDDSKNMLDTAFSKYKNITLVDDKNRFFDVKNGKYQKVMAKTNKFIYPLTQDEIKRIKIVENITPLNAPVKKGKNIGFVDVYLDNQLLFHDNFYTISNIKRKVI